MPTPNLFPRGAFQDFGPCEFVGGSAAPGLTQVAGPRTARLRAELRLQCPNKPGVYGMLDEYGELVYVGKARRLRTRLLSYFRPRSRTPKSGKVLRDAKVIVWEVWGHEFAALLREVELIRRWRPRWNVRSQPLRRRLAFLCLGRQPAPYFFLTRQPPKDVVASVGPLPAGPRGQDAARRLNDVFRLRECPQEQEMIFPEQGELFPGERAPGCLRYEIGACLGPCTGLCPQGDYVKAVRTAKAFLEGKDDRPLARLEAQMRETAAAQRYEQAATLRDRWTALSWLSQHLGRLRQAQQTLSFVYPLTGWDNQTIWFLIHGARLVAAVPAPTDDASSEVARAAIDTVYGGCKLSSLLAPYEHLDARWLIMSWFRTHTEELERALTPREALRRCRRPA